MSKADRIGGLVAGGMLVGYAFVGIEHSVVRWVLVGAGILFAYAGICGL